MFVRKRSIALASIVLVLLVTMTAGAAFAAGGVTNGGFETGDFSGWQVYTDDANDGSWYMYSGTAAPRIGSVIPAPVDGTYAATSDQVGPGLRILYQDVTIPKGLTFLSFTFGYENRAPAFATPDSLEFVGVANQQCRVDLMTPSADITSVAPGDVRQMLYRTEVGEPNSMPYTPMQFDVSKYVGQTFRLRFSDVDNQSYIQCFVDNVQIQRPFDQLRADTQALVTNASAQRALLASVDRAETTFNAGNRWQTWASINQYMFQVMLYARSGKVSPSAVNQLTTEAHDIANLII
jgi:hypothetical protein